LACEKDEVVSKRASAIDRNEPNGAKNFLDEAYETVTSLVLKLGYDNTPMSLIAEKLGLTKAGVYHHVESKEDLLYSIHCRAVDRLFLPIIEQAESENDPEKRLRIFLFEYARLMTRDPSARVFITEARRLAPKRYAEIRAVWRRGFVLMRDALKALQASGRCRRELDPTYMAFAALGMCSWIFYWFDYARQETGDAVAKTMCEVFISGVLTQRQENDQPVTRRKS
jgi:AcrR family transcriptional regulator